MSQLDDETVLPAHVAPEWTPAFSGPPAFMRNFALRFGEVTARVYPDDTKSLSKKFVEYSVYVQERWGGVGGGRLYTNCVLLNSLAGLADKETWDLRADPKAINEPGKGPGKGSKVLVLCVNGEERQAVILGGLRDQADEAEEKKKAKDLGHYYDWEFNGISFFVDDDGAWTLTRLGKTKDDGSLDDSQDKSSTGTRVAILKSGTFKVATVDSNGDDEQQLVVDHEKKKIFLKPKEAVEIGEATDKMVRGTTYRRAEKKLHAKMSAAFSAIQQNMTQLAATLAAAGSSITPTSAIAAAPQLAQAAAAAGQMASQAGQAKSALDEFENDDSGYLSKHLLD